MLKTIAVMPAYNEEMRIGRVVRKTRTFTDDVIVVDDSSSDNTASVAEKEGAHVIKLDRNFGAGFATRIGCDCALRKGADIIVTIDADGQHNPHNIPSLLKPLLLDEADIVFGVRHRDNKMPFGKRMGNAFLCLLSKILFKSDINDILTGFHAFKSSCYGFLRWDSRGYGVVSEIVYRAVKHKLRCRQILVDTIYNEKNNGMKKRHGIETILLMLKWKIAKD